MLKSSVCALLVAGLVAGCANDETGAKSAGTGAAVGAAVGAGIGALIGNRKGALIGAGIGALTGAGVGSYLGNQQRELEKNLEGTGATVTNTGEELLISLPSEITFAVDSATIQPQFYEALARVSQTLNEYDSSLIDVIGHTDSTGAEDYNLQLSQKRADSVANFLTGRGVLPARIVAYGRGEGSPIASNDTAEGRAMNRRVELIVTPITES